MLVGDRGDRLLVDLVGFQRANATVVEAIEQSPLVERAEAGLNTVPSTLRYVE